ncbi:hypothetical protein CANCADRAFT_148155 [Tortispora caseinolytica NRRL Y-17796]|uniref:C-8 sterol isomerase n=1 Tax=Tortispora caseinolytica NRRL Y-17796 TaxID=767744 RepID=A0A1E4TH40_9ASCO|nr:hypothetical protein CANCADRAFT_148155 [Tortispora caseinolytica NRRL Y-17796]
MQLIRSFLLVFSLILGVLYIVTVVQGPSAYVFDNKEVTAIVRDALEAQGALKTQRKYQTKNATDIVISVSKALHERYPEYVRELNFDEWVFNNAGGAMGAMFVFHASISEYLIVFGSAVGTEGHSGRHTANDYFTIIYGEEWAYSAGEIEPRIYAPGDMNFLPRGEVIHYSMPTTGWAIELAQGYIPGMLPFGFMDVITSTMDITNFAKTVYISARDMTYYALHGKF